MVDFIMKKEIVSVGKREDKLIRFKKSDDAKVGVVYVLYPDELEVLQKQIADAHDEIALLRNKMADDETIKLDEIVDMINNMDNRVSKIEADVLSLNNFHIFFI